MLSVFGFVILDSPIHVLVTELEHAINKSSQSVLHRGNRFGSLTSRQKPVPKRCVNGGWMDGRRPARSYCRAFSYFALCRNTRSFLGRSADRCAQTIYLITTPVMYRVSIPVRTPAKTVTDI